MNNKKQSKNKPAIEKAPTTKAEPLNPNSSITSPPTNLKVTLEDQ